MINPTEFYPTPPAIARKMADNLGLCKADYKRKRYVLDPCAGTGVLLEACAPGRSYDQWGRDSERYVTRYAVEIEPELRAVLESKGFTVVGYDFLRYEPRMQYTDIIMNPPFSKAREFAIHAWEMLVSGTIVTLYPVTSLEGKTEKERLVLDLIEQFGEVEILGPVFAKSDRPTDVEVAMITLRKSMAGVDGLDDELEFDVKNTRSMPDWTEQEGTSLAPGGFIAQLLAHADASIGAYGKYNQARQEIKAHLTPFDSWRSDNRQTILEAADAQGSPGQRYNAFVEGVTEAAWNLVLGHPRFKKILTERARAMIDEFRKRQKRVDFNEENVRAMFAALVHKQDDLLDACVQDAFDTMTKYHEENRIYIEGWKSNKAWKVSKKIVLPYYVEYKGFNGGNGFDTSYSYENNLLDIDRAMCIVTSKDFDQINTVYAALTASFRRGDSKWLCYSTFFEIRYFKKGTIHLRFLNDHDWEQFNIAAAKGRKWVGGGFG